MASDEQLRLEAVMVDKVTGPLINMQRQVQAMANEWAKANKLGKSGSEAHSKALNQLRDDTTRLGNQVKGVLTPAMAAFGVSVFSTAGAIAAIAKSVDAFSASSRRISAASKISGIPKAVVEGYEDAGKALGITATEMDNSLKAFTKIQDEFHRLGRGPLADFFSTQPPQIREWGEALRNVKEPAEAVQKAIAFLQDERIPAVQRALAATQWGFNEAIVATNKNVQELVKLMEGDRQIKPPDWDRVAQDWILAKARLETVWDDLSDHVGHSMAPAFTQIANDLREFIKEHREELEQFSKDASKWLGSVNWHQFGEDAKTAATAFKSIADDIRPVAQAINWVVTNTTGWKNVVEGMIALKLAGWLYGALLPLRAMAGLMPVPGGVLALLAAGVGKLAGDELANKVKEAAGIDVNAADPRERKSSPALDAIRKEQDDYLAAHRGAPSVGGEGFGVIGGGPRAASPRSGLDWLKSLLPHKQMGGQISKDMAIWAHQGETIQPVGQGSGGGSGDAINTIAIGVRKGVYDGMIDFWQYMKGDKSGSGGGGLFQQAAYHPGGGVDTSPGSSAGGGLGGTHGGDEGGTAPVGSVSGGLEKFSLGSDGGPGKGPAVGSDGGPGQAPGKPSKGDPRGMTDVIRAAAAKYGVNPDLMLKVARGEGLREDYADAAKREGSYGAMQMRIAGPGSVGYEFQKATGRDLTNPINEAAAIDFAGSWIQKHGWGAWVAARKMGITGRMGVGKPPAAAAVAGNPGAVKAPAAGSTSSPISDFGQGGGGLKDPYAGFGHGSTPAFLQKGGDDKQKKSLDYLERMNPRRFAEGGVVTKPTLGLIGEMGPEAVIPLSGFNKGGIPRPAGAVGPFKNYPGGLRPSTEAEIKSMAYPGMFNKSPTFGSMQAQRDYAVSLIEAHMGETAKSGLLRQFMARGGEGMNAAQEAWCAHTVNSALFQAGIKGSGSAAANSFNAWATRVPRGQGQRGDVVTLPAIAGVRTGHVGMLTGPEGPSSVPYVSGNTGGGIVAQHDLPFLGGSNRVLEIRRAMEHVRMLKVKPGPGMGDLPTSQAQKVTGSASLDILPERDHDEASRRWHVRQGGSA